LPLDDEFSDSDIGEQGLQTTLRRGYQKVLWQEPIRKESCSPSVTKKFSLVEFQVWRAFFERLLIAVRQGFERINGF